MPGKYGSKAVTVTLDDAPGGTGRAITGHVLESLGVKIESALELSHAMGDSWEESTPSGMAKGADITITGFWDTTAATGPHAVMVAPDDDPQDATRTLVIVFGDSKTATMEGRLMSYEVLAEVGKLTRFTGVFRPSGAITWS